MQCCVDGGAVVTTKWPYVLLADTLEIPLRNGISPSSRGAVPGRVLTLSAVTRGRFDETAVKAGGFPAAIPQDKTVQEGDLLVCRGNGNRSLVGKGHFATRAMPDTAFPDTIIAARINRDQFTSAFLERLWHSPTVRTQIESLARTTNGTFKINQAALASIRLPCPPVAEQRRIAEVLDRADALRAKRRAALAQLATLTQSVFLDMFGDPVANTRNWDETRLGEVATFVGGGTPSRAIPGYYTGSICWATSKDMKDQFLDDTQEHVTEEAIRNSATKLVPPGTILVVVKSKVLMHSLPVAVARVPTCFGQDLKGISLDERSGTAYVSAALRFGQGWLLDRARGINTEGLSLDHLRRFPLLLPPASLQHEFEERADMVERLRRRFASALTYQDSLFASLQHRAFRGEL